MKLQLQLAAVKREFQEELNIEIETEKLLYFIENFFTYDKRKFHKIIFIYQIKNIDELPDTCFERDDNISVRPDVIANWEKLQVSKIQHLIQVN